MAANAEASSTAGDRFELNVPPGTIVMLGATRRNADDASYRAVRYDRLIDGVVKPGGANELREPVELPAVQGRSSLYVDAVHGSAAHPTKSKLSSEHIGEGVWRLFFSDSGGGIAGMFSHPEYVVTVRFRKPEYYERGGAGGGAGAAKGNRPATRPAAAALPANTVTWAGPNESVACGDFRVRLTSATVAPTKSPAADAAAAAAPEAAAAPDAATVAPPMLNLAFAVQNGSTTRKLTFRRWRGEDFPIGGDRIRDNFGNVYKLIVTDSVAPADPSVSLYPGKSASVELTFEAPVANAQFLEVELPATNVGGFKSVPLRFRVPASATRRGLPPTP
jgi:hypothetical protein